MNWDVWIKIEEILILNNIKPILAVVPNNSDEYLKIMPECANFWLKVRSWQGMGWTIALHGFNHVYLTEDPGIIGINKKSEFAGLPRYLQKEKLENALKIFKDNGVCIDAWVAPGHSFDNITIELLIELGIKVISDGYYLKPVKINRAVFIPQQLWRFRSFPTGIWTVCMHINSYTKENIFQLSLDIDKYKSKIVSLDNVLSHNSICKPTYFDKIFSFMWKKMIQIKMILKRL